MDVSPRGLLLWLLLLAAAAGVNCAFVPTAISNALSAFATALVGPGGSALPAWLANANDPCTPWPGVQCVSGAVKSLVLNNYNLVGSISCDLAPLATVLTSLDVSNNSLTGSIPSCLFSLTALSFLNVSRNWLNGSLPALPGTYPTNQLVLSVFDNQMVSTVPPSYTGLSKFAVAMCPGVYGPWPNALQPLTYSLGNCNNGGKVAPFNGAPGVYQTDPSCGFYSNIWPFALNLGARFRSHLGVTEVEVTARFRSHLNLLRGQVKERLVSLGGKQLWRRHRARRLEQLAFSCHQAVVFGGGTLVADRRPDVAGLCEPDLGLRLARHVAAQRSAYRRAVQPLRCGQYQRSWSVC